MTRIKICGITNIDDALKAVDFGADALGFIFADSPRQAEPEKVLEITKELPPFIYKVGVFTVKEISIANKIASTCGLNAVQLHGMEGKFRETDINVPVIQVFRVKNDKIILEIENARVPYFLLDTYDENLMGGTGRSFNWEIGREASKFGKVILSGGLNHTNIPEALDMARPYAVDVCSGIEKKPGRKDHAKMSAFIKEVREWDIRTN
jgi:phosphoribosylanthranilate isomerase